MELKSIILGIIIGSIVVGTIVFLLMYMFPRNPDYGIVVAYRPDASVPYWAEVYGCGYPGEAQRGKYMGGTGDYSRGEALVGACEVISIQSQFVCP